MTKTTYPIILVVEGAMDQAFLSEFLDCEFVRTNGSAVSRETIEYLKKASETREIVILTDPDSPGNRIRSRIAEEVPTAKHAFVRKEYSIKGKKVGVAESTKEEVLLALSHIIPGTMDKGALTYADLQELGLSGNEDASKLREKVEEALHLGHGNAKTFLKRVNALQLTKEDLRRAIHG
ncbi:MAG: ribonuclease M5 [Bacilli bacterium]|nr:ribonuclease M5 [Bacilli bacterium]